MNKHSIACPQPIRATRSEGGDDDKECATMDDCPPTPSVAQSTTTTVTKGSSRFIPTFSSYPSSATKRPDSPYQARQGDGSGTRRRSKKPINWRRVLLILALAIALAMVITLIVLVVPKRPTVYIKQVSVPSTSSYAVSSSGQIITVEGKGLVSGRISNPNLIQQIKLSQVMLEVFWVGYQGDDQDYFDMPALAQGELTKPLTLYPRDTVDFSLKTTFNHTGLFHVDPVWIDFVRRCLNQDEESRKLRLVFRLSAVVGGWWGERRRRYTVPQDLPCPLSPTQIVAMFKEMSLQPPELN